MRVCVCVLVYVWENVCVFVWCMWIYVHICTYICTCVCVCFYIRMYIIYLHMYAHMHTQTLTHTHTCMHSLTIQTPVCVCVRVCVCVCMCTYTRTYTSVCILLFVVFRNGHCCRNNSKFCSCATICLFVRVCVCKHVYLFMRLVVWMRGCIYLCIWACAFGNVRRLRQSFKLIFRRRCALVCLNVCLCRLYVSIHVRMCVYMYDIVCVRAWMCAPAIVKWSYAACDLSIASVSYLEFPQHIDTQNNPYLSRVISSS